MQICDGKRCCGALCLVRAEAPRGRGLFLLLTLAASAAVSLRCPVHSGDNGRPLVVDCPVEVFALGAAAYDLLPLACPAVVLAFSFVVGAGVDERLAPCTRCR